MTQIQPATSGQIVTNKYFLTVRTTYDGCTCCAKLPLARIPLGIIPLINPACFGFQVPPTFQAQTMPVVSIAI